MRQLAHKAIGVFFWLLMGALWVLLWRDGRATWSAFEGTGVRLAILAGTVFAITTWWVRHNVGIYRRKGPRSGRPENLPRTDVDRLGRVTRWSLPGGHVAARDVPHLIVELDGDVKRYRRAGSR
jgi:hypothetical protein